MENREREEQATALVTFLTTLLMYVPLEILFDFTGTPLEGIGLFLACFGVAGFIVFLFKELT